MDLIGWLKEEWSAIRQAPRVIITGCVLSFMAGFGVDHLMSSSESSVQKATIKHLEVQVSDFKAATKVSEDQKILIDNLKREIETKTRLLSTMAQSSSPSSSVGGAVVPTWFLSAILEIGEAEIPGPQNNPRVIEYVASIQATDDVQDDEIDWASAFAEWTLNRVGISGPRNLSSNSWVTWGRQVDVPEIGCIVVFGFNHVGFYVKDENGYVSVLGGNQNNQVMIKSYPKKDVLTYRMPPAAVNANATVPNLQRP